MAPSFEDFKARFKFAPHLSGHVGVEREWFIVENATDRIVPRAPEVIAALGGTSDVFTYELSACQGESRHGPCRLLDLKKLLVETDRHLQETLRLLGLRAEYISTAPADLPLDVYPDERYLGIVKEMPKEKLAAACRTAGTHVHIGMRDHKHALHSYRERRAQCDHLVSLGNCSDGERFKLYERVQPQWQPRAYESWYAFYLDALASGFAENPRDNWQIIRITAKGTLEYRMFDSTPEVDKIVEWAAQCA